MVDPGFASAWEAASPAVPKCEDRRDGDAAAEAEALLFPPGDAGVDNGVAAFAGGFKAVGEAEAAAEAEAEAEAEVGVALEAV